MQAPERLKQAPELLSPAGTFKNMRYAFAYGADAVYAGQPRYSLRVRNNDFKIDNLHRGIEYAHARGKQFYVASNIAPHNSKLKTYLQDMAPVIEARPDALIMSDPGLIMMVRDRWPEQAIHLSVQSNVVNWAAAQFWQRQGISRIILSRELSLEEIGEIREQCPGLEIETFVHGALCIAYSGRCLLSGYFNHRDPNQGTCTNACRWKYNTIAATHDDTGDLIAAQGSGSVAADSPDELSALIEDVSRPGKLMPVYEDEHGTYIMNSKDLRAVQHVARLTQMGVASLKIEGRTKSHYYVARTAQVYRQAIDDAVAGRPFNKRLMDELENLANRGYTEGFYQRHVHGEFQSYEQGHSIGVHQQFVGEVLGFDPARGRLEVEVKNRFEVGDGMELMLPGGNHRFVLEHIENLRGESQSAAPGSGHRVRIPLPKVSITPEQLEFALLMRDLAPSSAAQPESLGVAIS
ncbi:tRNA 5-hydroxyuridine modification protein YegQ [Vreelandella neptunia]|uniref:tRNA 5-hydroxyuridine modification protein YegQ n=1 Tax=Vreelandella neptunia TaxID=115551 RepID=A0ABZ0YM77_9GAMM|nr:tRNA 5-hydroxyuridine modification protein YegQ [Halomonas neptunia]MDN3560775.1 tRNA 5-hydroxyuridine modification protein YegQ [Halomonas neptunia]TDV97509.1 putative protease [Halomonas alkaliantarctica]WQH13086.1 tRNA 5-hydroxyuridine modification protein YegQ [Halomonas neptunia]